MPALERLYLGTGLHVQEELHLGRYKFACSRIEPGGTVLDAACGSGYGSAILAHCAERVVGLDVSADAIVHAREHFQLENIEFTRADLAAPLRLPDASFDAVVSFETIEHVRDQRRMLSEFHRLLKPGGTLIVSSPDRDIITGKAQEVNEFHVAELSKPEFVDLIGQYFRIDELYGQMRYETSPWKRVAKELAKHDAFGMRKRVRSWRVGALVDEMLAPSHRLLEAVNPRTPGEHWWLVAVAAKG
jgi:ubiquinone/menaquinone biosynthesis C-methylase UbiE